MKFVIQRVSRASVSVDGAVIGKINKGFLVLIGIGAEDGKKEADLLVRKMCGLRIFEDENEKMNLNLAAVGGAVLVVSQFTLYADTSSRRPGFSHAAPPALAIPLYEHFMAACRQKGFEVQHGEFGADMQVFSQNDGPVTILLEL